MIVCAQLHGSILIGYDVSIELLVGISSSCRYQPTKFEDTNLLKTHFLFCLTPQVNGLCGGLVDGIRECTVKVNDADKNIGYRLGLEPFQRFKTRQSLGDDAPKDHEQ